MPRGFKFILPQNYHALIHIILPTLKTDCRKLGWSKILRKINKWTNTFDLWQPRRLMKRGTIGLHLVSSKYCSFPFHEDASIILTIISGWLMHSGCFANQRLRDSLRCETAFVFHTFTPTKRQTSDADCHTTQSVGYQWVA